MPVSAHITLGDLKSFLHFIKLPSEARLTVIFEDQHDIDLLKRKKAVEAMRKLRGSGNGCLLEALLQERKNDKKL